MSDTWWTHHLALARLWDWLVQHDRAPMTETPTPYPDAVAYLEKPWKWTPEWEEMKKENANATHP